MKIKDDLREVNFNPITLSVTFESREEVEAFYQRMWTDYDTVFNERDTDFELNPSADERLADTLLNWAGNILRELK